jgi:hypothetical protein
VDPCLESDGVVWTLFGAQLYKNVLPTTEERIQYLALPVQYLLGPVFFYFDLTTGERNC